MTLDDIIDIILVRTNDTYPLSLTLILSHKELSSQGPCLYFATFKMNRTKPSDQK